MTDCIVFWQRMLTPHMTELARQLPVAGAEARYLLEITRSSRDAERPIIPPWDLSTAFSKGVPA